MKTKSSFYSPPGYTPSPPSHLKENSSCLRPAAERVSTKESKKLGFLALCSQPRAPCHCWRAGCPPSPGALSIN